MDTHGKTSRNLLVALGLIAVLVAVVIGVAQAPDSSDPEAGNPESAASAEDFEAALAGAPPKLAAIYAQGDALLDGGVDAFQDRLAELRGIPVVANAWASWCGPCRFEFPHFQSQALEHGKDVAFLGIDVDDAVEAAEGFLEELPLPYPSYIDGEGEIQRVWNTRGGLPVTAFYDSSGQLVHVREGQYRSEADLEADIERYAN
ncbi:MAG TPA: TlpA disulfide reductase family protein [Solirubrobacterales bacterium]|nr:TlpA disulfide reductase family protein [Solirubrobacterales bacterium]